MVVWADNQTNETAFMTNHVNFRLTTGTGSVALVRLTGTNRIVIDYMNYENIGADRSYGDFPDGVWTNREVFLYPTPGGTNNGATAPVPVFINEWMAKNSHTITNEYGLKADWFELFNAGTNTVDLSGYTLTDTLSEPAKWTIPTNTVIVAGGFLLVWADGMNSSSNLHTNFKLSDSGEEIGLYTRDGITVDSIVFGPQTADVSEGRWPDGDSHVYTMGLATPNAPNVLTTNNAPPVLDAIADKSVVEKTLLTFAAHATDTDSPPQRLTYTLDSGAPAGAVINPTNGVFTWTPTEAEGPSTNPVTIRATDNGFGSLSDFKTIVITVTESNDAPQLGAIGNIHLNPGSLLTLTLTASDDDIPIQTLVFSLDLGYPDGASVDAASGVFQWMPDDDQAGTTNTIVIRVTDNGSPPMSATQTFVIDVSDLGELFEASGQTGTDTNGFTVRWNSESGETYRVDYQDNIGSYSWSNLPGTVQATGSVAIKVDSVTNVTTHRFYRIVRLLP